MHRSPFRWLARRLPLAVATAVLWSVPEAQALATTHTASLPEPRGTGGHPARSVSTALSAGARSCALDAGLGALPDAHRGQTPAPLLARPGTKPTTTGISAARLADAESCIGPLDEHPRAAEARKADARAERASAQGAKARAESDLATGAGDTEKITEARAAITRAEIAIQLAAVKEKLSDFGAERAEHTHGGIQPDEPHKVHLFTTPEQITHAVERKLAKLGPDPKMTSVLSQAGESVHFLNAPKLSEHLNTAHSALGVAGAALYINGIYDAFQTDSTDLDKAAAVTGIVPVVGQAFGIADAASHGDGAGVAVNVASLGALAIAQAVPGVDVAVDAGLILYVVASMLIEEFKDHTGELFAKAKPDRDRLWKEELTSIIEKRILPRYALLAEELHRRYQNSLISSWATAEISIDRVLSQHIWSTTPKEKQDLIRAARVAKAGLRAATTESLVAGSQAIRTGLVKTITDAVGKVTHCSGESCTSTVFAKAYAKQLQAKNARLSSADIAEVQRRLIAEPPALIDADLVNAALDEGIPDGLQARELPYRPWLPALPDDYYYDATTSQDTLEGTWVNSKANVSSVAGALKEAPKAGIRDPDDSLFIFQRDECYFRTATGATISHLGKISTCLPGVPAPFSSGIDAIAGLPGTTPQSTNPYKIWRLFRDGFSIDYDIFHRRPVGEKMPVDAPAGFTHPDAVVAGRTSAGESHFLFFKDGWFVRFAEGARGGVPQPASNLLPGFTGEVYSVLPGPGGTLARKLHVFPSLRPSGTESARAASAAGSPAEPADAASTSPLAARTAPSALTAAPQVAGLLPAQRSPLVHDRPAHAPPLLNLAHKTLAPPAVVTLIISEQTKASAGGAVPDEAAIHMRTAHEAGQSYLVTIDRPGNDARRKSNAKGMREFKLEHNLKGSGKDVDEVPMAMFKEGGTDASKSVRPSFMAVDSGQNRSLGARISQALKGTNPGKNAYADGQKVRLIVVEHQKQAVDIDKALHTNDPTLLGQVINEMPAARPRTLSALRSLQAEQQNLGPDTVAVRALGHAVLHKGCGLAWRT